MYIFPNDIINVDKWLFIKCSYYNARVKKIYMKTVKFITAICVLKFYLSCIATNSVIV